MFEKFCIVLLFAFAYGPWKTSGEPQSTKIDSASQVTKMFAPFTNWCGPGNRARSYDDLGANSDIDVCCRDHDSCPLYIPAKETAHGLRNTDSYTASHCTCDKQFDECTKQDRGILLKTLVRGAYWLGGPRLCFIEDLGPSVEFNVVIGSTSYRAIGPENCLRNFGSNIDKTGAWRKAIEHFDTNSDIQYKWRNRQWYIKTASPGDVCEYEFLDIPEGIHL